MARYLITGIAGFIGSSLAHELLQRGHEVRGIDNLCSGDLKNLEPVLNHLDFRLGDITDKSQMQRCCKGIDFVLHQAALASVPRSIKDPVSSHEANIDGTLSVLLAARDAGVSRVVYAASSSAYGDQLSQPKHESMLPCPLSPYAVQKLAGEHYVQSFWHMYGMEGVCLRYFNVFGPKQSADSPYSGVIARFVTDMISGTRPTIFGDGLQSRDFTYISNVVSANLLACAAAPSGVAGEVFNIGTGKSQTLNSLYACLAELLHFKPSPIHAPVRNGDIEQSEADIYKAEKMLGYQPLTSFTEGLQQTVAWYLDRNDHLKADCLKEISRMPVLTT